jgi:hypothetical protein
MFAQRAYLLPYRASHYVEEKGGGGLMVVVDVQA